MRTDEAQSRRENLKFYGFPDKGTETWEETESIVRNYIKSDLQMDEKQVSIERAHRVASQDTSSKAVIVKFSFFKDKDRVLKEYRRRRKEHNEIRNPDDRQDYAGNLADDNTGDNTDSEFRSNIYISEDFPRRVSQARYYLRPFLKIR